MLTFSPNWVDRNRNVFAGSGRPESSNAPDPWVRFLLGDWMVQAFLTGRYLAVWLIGN
jgi:hypothetical protein